MHNKSLNQNGVKKRATWLAQTLRDPHEIMNKYDQKQQLSKYAYLYWEIARHCKGIK